MVGYVDVGKSEEDKDMQGEGHGCQVPEPCQHSHIRFAVRLVAAAMPFIAISPSLADSYSLPSQRHGRKYRVEAPEGKDRAQACQP